MYICMELYKELADQYNLWLLEDSCHSLGGSFIDKNGIEQKCGNGKYADVAIFSFHPVKHLACGEGGMITTNNHKLYEKLLLLRSHGINKYPNKISKKDGGWFYEMQELGYNYRMPDILCALGLSQLNRANQNLEKRRRVAKRYIKAFKNTKVNCIQLPKNIHHAFHLFVIKVENRLGLYKYLKKMGIYSQVHYIPLHKAPYYESIYGKQFFLESESYYQKCLSIPMYPTLKKNEQDYVIENINKWFKKERNE